MDKIENKQHDVLNLSAENVQDFKFYSVDKAFNENKEWSITKDEFEKTMDNPYSFDELLNMNVNDFWEFDSNWNFHVKNEVNCDYSYGDDDTEQYFKKAIRINDRAIFEFKTIRWYREPIKWFAFYCIAKWEFKICWNDGNIYSDDDNGSFFCITFKSDWTKESWHWKKERPGM